MPRLLLSSALALSCAAASLAASFTAGLGSPSAAATGDDPAAAPAVVSLAHAARGAAGVRALGARLPAVARLNGLTPAQLSHLLRTDSTMVVGRDGHLSAEDHFAVPATSTPLAQQVADFTPVAPLDQTFSLHSLPGSTHTIYLDFVGATVHGTVWNDPSSDMYAGWPTITVTPWTVGSPSSTFDDDERLAIQEIWSRVAEDYAPFDIDVTTADPGVDALDRTDALDTSYGAQILFAPDSAQVSNTWCFSCSGISQISAFDETGDHQYRMPAWVYTDGLHNDVAWMAEAASHEAGHTLGLFHDGDLNPDGTITQYDSGHGVWAAIMGSTFDHAVTQWSLGEYAGADNTQDDVAVIAGHTGGAVRADETGSTLSTSVALPVDLPAGAPTGVIGSRADTDVYDLGDCSGTVDLSALANGAGADLDIALDLLDSTGAVVASADPAVAQHGGDNGADQPVATGLDASLTQAVASGHYYARIDGVGDTSHHDDPTTSYDDYGSLGHYTLTAGGCTPGTSAPAAPALVTAGTFEDGSVPLTWVAPGLDGNSAVTGYQVSVDGQVAATLDAGTTSYTATGLTTGPHTFAVTAVNAVGTGPSTTAAIGAPDAPHQADAVLGFDAASRTQTVQVTWDQQGFGTPPGGTPWPGDGYRVGGVPILGYHVYDADGTLLATAPAGATSVPAVGVAPGEHYVASVAAYNELGESPKVSVETTAQRAPSAITGAHARVDAADQQVTVTFQAPASPDSPLTAIRTRKDGAEFWSTVALSDDPAHTYSYTFVGMRPGAHTIDLVASNLYADSAVTTLHVTVAKPATRPAAPAAPKVRPGAKGGALTAVATWGAPASTGGAAVTGYRLKVYRLNSRGAVVATTTTGTLRAGVRSYTIKARKGAAYRVAVQAHNAVGWSPLSRQSARVRGR